MGTLNALMGDYGALQLRFWADIQDYSKAAKNSPYHGFTVAFHDRDSYGSTLSSGYLMSPGSYYKVDLRMRKPPLSPEISGVNSRDQHLRFRHEAVFPRNVFSSNRELDFLQESREPPPSGHCDDSQPFTTYGNYSEGACIMECKDK
eukprot:sb/3473807/